MARPEKGRSDLSARKITDLALRQIEAEGPQGISFRSLAKQLSVTPMALAHHIGTREDLLKAMVLSVFHQMEEINPNQSPSERILALMSDYCRRVLAHPRLVQIVFSDPLRYYPGPLEQLTVQLQSLLTLAGKGQLVRDVIVDYTHGFALSAAAARSAGLANAPGLDQYRQGLAWILQSPA
ncbi:TetR family transcriptional regulator [Aestuariispira insulae]|uniref:TetR family transcriptional regulator n=1 Tax=Aestuariispira insulae TaxID=1461337 RepID=A0A3D9HYE9_9PROT|nr:TetR family transcriptional regulator [Aestuariispira insulae]RED54381.1 TetR family transcriptional regulator [Aestuariispira insulae]